MKKVISVAIIEDLEDIRESLLKFFQTTPDILCEATVDSVEAFLNIEMADMNFNVLLLDIGLPGMSGLTGIKFIKEKYPNIEIIMLTVFEEHDKIFRALKSGAAGYLLKTTPFPKIREAIIETYNGGAAMSPTIARKVIAHFNRSKAENRKPVLTETERKIVAYLVDGYTYKKIAKILGNSVDTIRFHIKNIYKKLHISSRAELISKELN